MQHKLTTILKPKRGSLNDAAVTRYREATGRELTVAELRLLPFIQYVVTNEGCFTSQKINDEELAILKQLDEEGRVLLHRTSGRPGFYDLAVSDAYWTCISRVLATTYVYTAV